MDHTVITRHNRVAGSCLITGSFTNVSHDSPGLIESQNPPAPR